MPTSSVALPFSSFSSFCSSAAQSTGLLLSDPKDFMLIALAELLFLDLVLARWSSVANASISSTVADERRDEDDDDASRSPECVEPASLKSPASSPSSSTTPLRSLEGKMDCGDSVVPASASEGNGIECVSDRKLGEVVKSVSCVGDKSNVAKESVDFGDIGPFDRLIDTIESVCAGNLGVSSASTFSTSSVCPKLALSSSCSCRGFGAASIVLLY